MPADALGAELGHRAYDEPAGDRDQHAEPAEHVEVGTRKMRADLAGVDEVGQQSDQVEQRQSDAGNGGSDHDGRTAQQQHPSIGREVTQPAFLHASSSRGVVVAWHVRGDEGLRHHTRRNSCIVQRQVYAGGYA